MALVVIALVLFAMERIPLATSSLLVLVLLALLFEVFPYVSVNGPVRASDLFLGFGHQALIAVCSLMIAGQALVRTGALEPIGRQLARWWTHRPLLSFLATLVLGAMLSAFINNTPVVILLLPILISVSLKTPTPASDLLMPVGLATSVGGMATTIGTSTNLLVEPGRILDPFDAEILSMYFRSLTGTFEIAGVNAIELEFVFAQTGVDIIDIRLPVQAARRIAPTDDPSAFVKLGLEMSGNNQAHRLSIDISDRNWKTKLALY